MAPRGNKVIPNAHFHKNWQRYVKTWFNQPGRKARRYRNRVKKAKKIAPRPVGGPLRPIVHCPTFKYHLKVRLGRGFTLEELKGIKLNPRFARTIGIAVDHRRRNKSVESIQLNVQRLKEYMSKLILFPRHSNKKLQKGEATEEERKMATQLKTPLMPIKKTVPKLKTAIITEEMRNYKAYYNLRKARLDAKNVGLHAKRQREAQENPEEITKAKKK